MNWQEEKFKLHLSCSVNSKLTHYPVASLCKSARLSSKWNQRDSILQETLIRENSDALKKIHVTQYSSAVKLQAILTIMRGKIKLLSTRASILMLIKFNF